MKFRDITHEEITDYTLKENEQCVFFALNKQGQINLHLVGQNAHAYLFALFLAEENTYHLNITQHHQNTHTTSQVVTKSILGKQSDVAYIGLIHIDASAHESTATQESRALLLSSEARHSAIPSLEILPRDVTCHHKASAAPLNPESLFYLQSHGLNKKESARMLIHGFVMSLFEEMTSLGVESSHLEFTQKNIAEKINTHYA